MWQIEHQCTQCGAPVVLDESDRLFTCPFCRVRLYLIPHEAFRYYLSPQIPMEDTLFVPYWRFKGMMFSAVSYNVVSGIIDSSYLASGHSFLPLTLGIRPQVMKLRFISPATEGASFIPHTPFNDTMPLIERRLDALDVLELDEDGIIRTTMNNPSFYKTFLGEISSLIYAPVSLKNNMIYDGVLDRPLGPISEEGSAQLAPERDAPQWKLKFISTLCPHCGWDLSGEKESLALLCRNCNSLWEPNEDGLTRMEFEVMQTSMKDAVYLPFWKTKARVDGLTLRSYADLVRLANLPKVIQPEWARQELTFWTPAFKVPPELYMRLCRQLTIVQPRGEVCEEMPSSQFYPVTFPKSGISESIKVTIANLAVRKKDLYPKLKNISVTTDTPLLVYIPFQVSTHEFIQPEFEVSVHKNAFKTGENI